MTVRIEQIEPEHWGALEADYEPGTVECSLDQQPVGYVYPFGDDDSDRVTWRPYFEIQIEADAAGPGDAAPTLWCEDCFGWLEEIAPAITGRANELAMNAASIVARVRGSVRE